MRGPYDGMTNRYLGPGATTRSRDRTPEDRGSPLDQLLRIAASIAMLRLVASAPGIDRGPRGSEKPAVDANAPASTLAPRTQSPGPPSSLTLLRTVLDPMLALARC